MKTMTKILFSAMIFMFISAVAIAQPPKWEKLGTKLVDFKVDRDELIVTAYEGVFTAIKIKVFAAPINMHKMVIHFGNGNVQDVDLKNNFAPGSESRVIDLPGDHRIIQKIVFFYDTKNAARKKARVEVWGRH